jgi:hypothetical protein
MGYPQPEKATDEWEIERNTGKPRSAGNPFAWFVQHLATSHVRETIRIALTSKETVS